MTKQYKYKRRRLRKPIPEIGKRYHCFDDGKVTFSRHFIIQIDEVLGYQQFRKKYFDQFVKYMKRPQSHSIYDELSDGELRELWEDVIADQVINEQKSCII